MQQARFACFTSEISVICGDSLQHFTRALVCKVSLYLLVLLVKQVKLLKMETLLLGTVTLAVLALRLAVDFVIIEYIHERQTEQACKRDARRATIQNP